MFASGANPIDTWICDLLQSRDPNASENFVIWPMSDEYLVDLNRYFSREMSWEYPEVVGDYVSQGTSAAVPCPPVNAVLTYRDLEMLKVEIKTPDRKSNST